MILDPIRDELKDLKRIEKVFIFKRILFPKLAILHGKCELFTIKESICHQFPRD